MKKGIEAPIFEKTDKIGDRLRKLRKEAGLTQAQLADDTVFSVKTIQHIESGKTTPDLNTLEILADNFGVSVDFMLCRTTVRNIGNEEMSELTGLTEESIEVLRYLHSVPASPSNDVATTNNMTVDMINRALSEKAVVERVRTQRHSSNPFPVETLFTDLRRYLYNERVEGSAHDIYAEVYDPDPVANVLDPRNKSIDFDVLSMDALGQTHICTVREAYEAIQFQHLIEKLTRMKEAQREAEKAEKEEE